MSPNVRKGFIAATVVHMIFVGTLLFFAFWEPRREPEPMVFELVSLPSEVPAPEPVPETELQPVTFEFEDIPVPPPPEREPRPPRPEPAPPPKQDPPPPKPEPKPDPKPEPPPPEKVDYRQFRQKNPLPEPKPRPEPPRPEPITAPPIDTRKITERLKNATFDQETQEQVRRQTPQDQNRMAAYFERLRSDLRGAWQRPPGLPSHLEVRIRFDLAADGRIGNVRIASSSGNPAFDDSVVEAFRRLGSAGPTPDRQSYSPSLLFGVD